VLSANPLDDIANTRKINKVYLRAAMRQMASGARPHALHAIDRTRPAGFSDGRYGRNVSGGWRHSTKADRDVRLSACTAGGEDD
jgi:hypothetical protein